MEQIKIDLAYPLLILKGSKGLLTCGYLNIETFNATGEVAAIVADVNSFEDMLTAKVIKVSDKGFQAGLHVGMLGSKVIEIIR